MQFAFNAIRQHCFEMSEKQSLKRKITTKSLEEKYKALKDIESGVAKKDVATKYGIPKSTLSTWVKSKEKITAAFEDGKSPKTMKLKGAGFDALDKAIYKWFMNARERNVPISGALLKEKAVLFAKELQIEDFKGSDGWLDRWKTRHSVTFKTVAGEAKSCTPEMTASWDETTLPTIISNYKLEDIYNADEFGLFYQALPDKTLHLKSEKCVGGKHSKTRLTGMAAANAVGEKLPMFVIGKSAKPRCFAGVRNLPCRYRSQKKSWMDSTLFEEWIRELDRKFLGEGRKVALIVDNCPAHPHVEGLKAIQLVFLPPNTTSKTQPMDQGVIRSLKAHYRALTVQLFIRAVDNNQPLPKISILSAMNMLTAAWDKVSETTVQNCFKRAGISEQSQEHAMNDTDDPFKELTEELENLRERAENQVSTQVSAETMIECDDDLLTADTELPSDSDILAEFRVDDKELEEALEEDDEVFIDEPPPKRPSRHELCQAIDVLQTFGLFVEVEMDSFKTNLRKLSRIVDSNRFVEKRQGLLTDYFTKK